MLKLQQSEEIDWSEVWSPKITVTNSIGDTNTKSFSQVSYDKFGHATVTEKQKLSGNFFEFMELNMFPFDKQVTLLNSSLFHI